MEYYDPDFVWGMSGMLGGLLLLWGQKLKKWYEKLGVSVIFAGFLYWMFYKVSYPWLGLGVVSLRQWIQWIFLIIMTVIGFAVICGSKKGKVVS